MHFAPHSHFQSPDYLQEQTSKRGVIVMSAAPHRRARRLLLLLGDLASLASAASPSVGANRAFTEGPQGTKREAPIGDEDATAGPSVADLIATSSTPPSAVDKGASSAAAAPSHKRMKAPRRV